MAKYKNHVENVARSALEKEYGNEYSLDSLKKSERPDFIGKNNIGQTLGLEICEAALVPLTTTLAGSPKNKNIKPLSELSKEDNFVAAVGMNHNGVIKNYAILSDKKSLSQSIVENAVATYKKHLNKLQDYQQCDIYELAIMLPAVIVGNLFSQYVEAISIALNNFEINKENRYFNYIYILNASDQVHCLGVVKRDIKGYRKKVD